MGHRAAQQAKQSRAAGDLTAHLSPPLSSGGQGPVEDIHGGVQLLHGICPGAETWPTAPKVIAEPKYSPHRRLTTRPPWTW